MACPTTDTLQSLVENRLPRPRREELLAHAEDCPACHAILAELMREATVPGAIDPQADEDAEQAAPGLALERGSTLDHFIIIERLGAGGMGVVWSAYDPSLDRKVAIKVVRPRAIGARTPRDLRERLVREAQAVAKLNHPSVITVYEAGTVGEDVFVAMEYVDGGTLTDWLAAGRRSWPAVAEVFVRIGRGLAAAHAAGLVHRDFKPDNVLVGKDGRIRVTDFGLVMVAPGSERDSSDSGAASPALTMTGALVGTPRYMAPEQHRRRTVDARADQFAFCVALYEALYGIRPFEGTSLAEIALAVEGGQVREPPKPPGVPARLRRVVMRGLRAAPAERYPTMDALLADLAHDPRGPRRTAALAMVALALLAVGAVAILGKPVAQARPCLDAARHLDGVWDDPLKAQIHAAFGATGRPFAEAAWLGVGKRLDGYAHDWVAMHTEACEATRLRGEQSEHALDLRMTCLGQRRSELRALTGLLAGADSTVVEKALASAAALHAIAACADLTRLEAPMPLPADEPTRVKVAVARAELAVAEAYRQAGKVKEALTLAEPALATARDSGYGVVLAEALLVKGRLEGQGRDPKAGEALLFDAALAAESARADEVKVDAHSELAQLLCDALGRYDDSLRAAQVARAILARLRDPAREARLLVLEGNALDQKTSYDQAREKLLAAAAIEEKLEPRNPLLAQSILVALGSNEYGRDRYEDAIGFYRRGLEILERELGSDHPRVARIAANIGSMLQEEGKNGAAIETFQKAEAIFARALSPDHPDAIKLLANIAHAYENAGNYSAAVENYRHGLEIFEPKMPENPLTAVLYQGLATTYKNHGDLAEAMAAAERALAIREKVLGPEHDATGQTLNIMANILDLEGKYDEALARYQRASAIFEKSGGKDSVLLAIANAESGHVLAKQGHYPEARARLEGSRAVLEKQLGAKHPTVGMLDLYLGEMLERQGQHAKAVTWLEPAVAIFVAQPAAPRVIAEAQLALAGALWDSRQDRGRAVTLAQASRAGDKTQADAWLAHHAAP